MPTVEEVLERRMCRLLYSVGCEMEWARLYSCPNALVFLIVEGVHVRVILVKGKIVTNKHYELGNREQEEKVADLLDSLLFAFAFDEEEWEE